MGVSYASIVLDYKSGLMGSCEVTKVIAVALLCRIGVHFMKNILPCVQ